MKKLIVFLICAFSVFAGYSQTNLVQGKTVQATQYLVAPLDTLLAPRYLGEQRRRLQDTGIYVAIRLTGFPKWTKVITNSQVFFLGNTDTAAGYPLLYGVENNIYIRKLIAGSGIAIDSTLKGLVFRVTALGSGDVISNETSNSNNQLVLFGTQTDGKHLQKSTASGRPLLTAGVLSTANIDLSTEVTGNLGVTRLNSGTGANSGTYWRGDGVWAAITAALGLGNSVTSATQNGIFFGGTGGQFQQKTSDFYYDSTNSVMTITRNIGNEIGINIVNPSGGGNTAIKLQSSGLTDWKLGVDGLAGSFPGALTMRSGGITYYGFTDQYLSVGAGIRAALTTTGAGTYSIATNNNFTTYVFTGTTSTWTLPTIANGGTGRIIYIKNRGSGTITLNSNAGGNDIYSTSAVNTLAITAGSAIILINDGTYWLVN